MAAYDAVGIWGTVAVVSGSLLWSDVNKFSPGVLRFMRVWVKDSAFVEVRGRAADADHFRATQDIDQRVTNDWRGVQTWTALQELIC